MPAIKQLLFLLYAERIIEIGYPTAKISPNVFLQDRSIPDAKPGEVHVSESLNAFLSRVKISSDRKNKIKQQGIKFKECDPNSTFGILSMPEPLLSLPFKCCEIVDFDKSNENASGYKNALVWGFDSLMNQYDSLTSFIQLSIALEAILGVDAERKDKTRQLADRFALLVGNNRLSRQQQREKFIEFYKIRSELVHGSKTEVDEKVSEWQSWGNWALKAVLRKELWLSNFDPPKS